jgi:hypothetical protein
MTHERTVQRVIAHPRTQVAELGRMQREGAKAEEVEERKRPIVRLQRHLAYSVTDLLDVRFSRGAAVLVSGRSWRAAQAVPPSFNHSQQRGAG